MCCVDACDLGQFLNDVGRHAEAADSYLTASRLLPDDFELIFNTASALRSVTSFLPSFRQSVCLPTLPSLLQNVRIKPSTHLRQS